MLRIINIIVYLIKDCHQALYLYKKCCSIVELSSNCLILLRFLDYSNFSSAVEACRKRHLFAGKFNACHSGKAPYTKSYLWQFSFARPKVYGAGCGGVYSCSLLGNLKPINDSEEKDHDLTLERAFSFCRIAVRLTWQVAAASG